MAQPVVSSNPFRQRRIHWKEDTSYAFDPFRQAGEFVPLQVDRQGKIIREVALARFSLPLPEHPGQELEVRVALIRDLRRLLPKAPWYCQLKKFS